MNLLFLVRSRDVYIHVAGDILKILPQLNSQIIIEDVHNDRDPLSRRLVFRYILGSLLNTEKAWPGLCSSPDVDDRRIRRTRMG
jgi:hypothetical protein